MKKAIGKFLRDERGSVSVEEIVVLGGALWMLIAVVTDISVATVSLSDRISNELQYNSVLNDILEGYGPNSKKVRPDAAEG